MSILDKQVFNSKQLGLYDQKLRQLVDESYDFCLYRCAEKPGNIQTCKESCFKDIIVPFRFKNHASRDEEDNLYRKCLAQKFPSIKHEDYIDCTNLLHKDRLKMIGDQLVSISENTLNIIH
ncbi:UNKNOWN [Stylonychia lemnae]|uniref:Uncharacterized protein n=1 Tax=Stylonychia lemnae TaxID=5949 RepID=A0A078AKZ4_STYLE|nr:UNKNOWN [Stylonychia lemnae]|eukprot:CDW82551.1 UNKNOWN [Stylonychia lemnae]